MRLFLDSNVLLSVSLRPIGNAAGLFELCHRGACRLLASSYVIEEAERNLAKKAPQALARCAALGTMLEIVPEAPDDLLLWAAAQGLPAKDAPILAAAVAGGADLLVTGDRRHFAALFGRTCQSVRILSLAQGLATALEASAGSRH